MISKIEYLFGTSSVLLALQGARRRITKLFIQGEEELAYRTRQMTASKQVNQACELANSMSIPIVSVRPSLLEKYSFGNVHNGLVLSCSPLVAEHIKSLGPIDNESNYNIQCTGENIEKSRPNQARFPVWLVLAQIHDPMNIGAILRTAHFYNVDGVVVTDSSPLTPSVSKASAGALEVMTIYSTSSLSKFLLTSQQNGWTVFGTDLKGSNPILIDPLDLVPPLLIGPTMLVIGNEGSGLSSGVSKICDANLIISTGKEIKPVGYSVESLNVSVATGILLHKLLDS